MSETAARTPRLTLRAAVPEDLDALVRLERAAQISPWTAGMLAPYLTGGDAFMTVALLSCRGCDRLVGYGLGQRLLDGLDILNLAVLPAFRGRGIGRALLTRLLDDAERHGLCRVTLEVRVSNRPARRLYERCGFVTVGRRRGYYADTGEDALLMTREPDAPDA